MRGLLTGVLGTAIALAVAGCVRGPITTTKDQEKTESSAGQEQTKLLEEIRAYQRDTGATLDSLAKEIARRKAMEASAVGPSPLQRDLNVARALLVATRRAVQSEDLNTATATLRRLGATVDVMQGETPAAQIRTYLERAALALQGSAAGIEADVASACVLAATDVALKSPDATLVPETAKDLEKVKAQIDKGDYKDSLRVVEELAKTISNHKSVVMLERVEAGVRGAREAMDRQAGIVVLAELDQLSDLFNAFSTMVRGAPPAEEQKQGEAGAAKGEQKTTASEETGKSAGQSNATGSAAGAGQPPAAASAGGEKAGGGAGGSTQAPATTATAPAAGSSQRR